MNAIYVECESWKMRAEQAEAARDHWRDYAQELKRDVLTACLELQKVRDELANCQAFCAILERRLTEAGK